MKREYMQAALHEAREAGGRGEVPVGAVVVGPDGVIIARSGNRCIELADPVGHAEMLAIREAGRILSNYRLPGCDIYVTLEPCVMCAGAMVHARLERLFFGADDPKTGAVKSLYRIGSDDRLNHQLVIEGGLMAAECSELLRDFFRNRRAALNADKKVDC